MPPAVAAVPAMLTDEERQYLSWVTATRYEGWGAIVDLGPWLGASSVALAEGLRASNKPGRVRSFDIFTWEPSYMSGFRCDLKDGDDFQPVFAQMTAAYADRIEGTRMDLMAPRWNEGPIEILFVDAAKTWELWRSILGAFGPFLQPGRSLVVHQDFRHPACPWLVLTSDDRPDVWQEVDVVDRGTTVTFRPLRQLASSDAPSLTNDRMPYARRRELLSARIARDGGANAWRYQMMLWKEAIENGDPLADTLVPALEAARGTTPDANQNISYGFDQGRLKQGWNLCHQRRFAEAAALAQQIGPGSRIEYEAAVLAGHAARGQNELERADALLAKARNLFPTRPAAHIETMWLRITQQRYAEAEQIGLPLVADDAALPQGTRASLLRAMTHAVARQGRVADGLTFNERALAAVPGHVDLRLDRARLLAALGRREEADSAFRQLREDHPTRADIEAEQRAFAAAGGPTGERRA